MSVHKHPAPGASENGDSAHQHYYRPTNAVDVPFLGPNNGEEPWTAPGVWINRKLFNTAPDPPYDDTEYAANRVAHSYISSDQCPRYKFVDAGTMPNDAESRVTDAFDLWAGIEADKSPTTGKELDTGICFESTTGNDFEIKIEWTDLSPDANFNGGAFFTTATGLHNQVTLKFDSTTDANTSFPWDFTLDALTSDLDEYHFMSVALHELGHVVRLRHSPDQDDDLMQPPVGLPLENAVGDFSYRWSAYTNTAHSENDFFTGRRFRRDVAGAAGAVSNIVIQDHESPDGIKSLYSIPIVPEPSTALLSGLSLACLLARGPKRRRTSQVDRVAHFR